MFSTRFANTWHDPPQYRVRLEFSCNILCYRLHLLKLNHTWPRGYIPYTALEPTNEARCFKAIGNAQNKKPHLTLINPTSLSPLQFKVSLNPLLQHEGFEGRWMSIERKSIWTVCIINKCYVYCFSLR